jgi:hypothetical protein
MRLTLRVCLVGRGSGRGTLDPRHEKSTDAPDIMRIPLPSIRPAQSLFPQFNYCRREFALSGTSASTGFGPHFKQRQVFVEFIALQNVVGLTMRPPLGCHFQKLYQRRDVFFLGIHDHPLYRVQKMLTPAINPWCVGYH